MKNFLPPKKPKISKLTECPIYLNVLILISQKAALAQGFRVLDPWGFRAVGA